MTDTFAVPCPEPPALDPLPPPLRARLRYDPAAGVLRGALPLAAEEIAALRDLFPAAPWWQWAVDRIASGDRAGKEGYATTLWGRLLVELPANQEEAWRAFLADYRRPIAGTIATWLKARGLPRAPAAELADDFFGWFFANQVHRNLRRVGDDGRVHRFRGYLKKCLRTYLEEACRRASCPAPAEAAVPASLEESLDLEYCRHLVAEELAVMARDHRSLHLALLADLEGATLAETAARLGGGEPVPLTTAHRKRHEARAAFRRRLIRFRLRDGALSEAEAAAEFRELIPLLARALRERLEDGADG